MHLNGATDDLVGGLNGDAVVLFMSVPLCLCVLWPVITRISKVSEGC